MDMKHCTLCPRRCGADRTERPGFCGGGESIRIARAALHFGEEPCITGKKGSGTVFFSGCALRCKFCQNGVISRDFAGVEISEERLCEIFWELQEQGAENINLVTPSHFAPQVAAALRRSKLHLHIPVVCNCGGYESAEILAYFDGLVDIYLPDLKYFSPQRSLRYSGAKDYFEVAYRALVEMYRQVGGCSFSEDGMLQKGLLIRHLVLPGGKEDSKQLLRWVSQTFPKDVWVSLMRQYTPCGDLSDLPEINRKLLSVEYSSVLSFAQDLGLNGFQQGRDCDNLRMTPTFDFTGVRKEKL